MHLVFSQKTGRGKTRRLYEYIRLMRKKYSVRELCWVLEVSESGYFRSLKYKDRTNQEDLLPVKIKAIIEKHPDNDNYGAQRIHLALMLEGENVSYSTVYRIMIKHAMLRNRKVTPAVLHGRMLGLRKART